MLISVCKITVAHTSVITLSLVFHINSWMSFLCVWYSLTYILLLQHAQPFCSCYTGQLMLRTGRFCWSKVLLPTYHCWQQLAHLHKGEDASFHLSSVNLCRLHRITLHCSMKRSLLDDLYFNLLTFWLLGWLRLFGAGWHDAVGVEVAQKYLECVQLLRDYRNANQDPVYSVVWAIHVSSFALFLEKQHNNNCCTALCPGLPGWAGTRRNTHPPTILIIQSLSAFSIYHDP